MELIKYENNQITVANELLSKMKMLHDTKVALEVEEGRLKQDLLEAMKQYDIKSIENEVFKAVYKAPTTRKSVDTQALKDQGIYDQFTKESTVKESVTLTYK